MKNFVTELCQRGYRRFVLDLTECQLMDSTFLGVLAGIGQDLGQASPDGRTTPIQLVNPNQRIADLLDSLGVVHLFEILGSTPAELAGSEAQPQAAGQASKEEVTRTCLEAHQTLMALNPANVSKFKDVTRFFEEDLKKLVSQPKS